MIAVQDERGWIPIQCCWSNEGNEYLGMAEVQAVTESGFDACVHVGNLE